MKSWQLGKPSSFLYKIFDLLRKQLNKNLASYLYQYIANRKKVKILEAGSGPGFCTSTLAKKRNISRAVIIDNDAEVLKLAKARDPSLIIKKGNILKIDYLSNSFDLVYNSSTLEHIENYKKAFSEMVRICKPGGYIFVGIPYKYSPLFIFNFFPKKGKLRQWIGEFIDPNEILAWQKKLSMKLENQIYYFFYFFKGFMFKKLS